jgi:hypothetical protein
MGAGAYAEQIAGTCNVIPTRTCGVFKELAVHTLVSSPALGSSGPVAGSFGCGAYGPNPGTQLLPLPKIPSALDRHPLYGNTSGAITLPTYFQAAQLAPWRSRQIIGPGDPYNNRASGPAIQQGHMVTMLRRRLRPQQAAYIGKPAWYFTDAAAALSNQQDWLVYLNPAEFFWTNKGLAEPFLAVDYYEQTGQLPTTADVYNQRFMPFCTPMNAYSSGGTLLGQYVGYTWIYFFGQVAIKYPIPGFRPTDYLSPLPTPPEVPATAEFWSLDAHLYLVASPASAGSLLSPRLQSARHWVYNKDGSTWNICDQYLYMLCGAQYGVWNFDVTFNHVGGGSEVIKFGISNLNQYLVP